MTTAIDDLLALAPPPVTPCTPGSAVGWEAVERYFGFGFPADYRRLVGLYGTGCWGGLLWMNNPFSPNRYNNSRLILEGDHHWCAVEPVPPSDDLVFLRAWNQAREAARAWREACPHPLHPERSGLFPGAHSRDQVVRAYWLTEGDPDRWPVVIERRAGESRFSRPTPGGCAAFLAAWLREDASVEGLPAPQADGAGRRFVPWMLNPALIQEFAW